MYNPRGKGIKIFWEINLEGYLQDIINTVRTKITGETENYILNVNEHQYIAHLVEEFTADNLDLKFNDISISNYEAQIPAEYHPVDFFLEPGESYKRDIIKYHIPFECDRNLLHCNPNPRYPWTTDVSFEENCVCFEIINFNNDPEEIKREAQHTITNIKEQFKNVQNQINSFNATLEKQIRGIFQSHKAHILKKHNFLTALEVPIKKRDDLPKTFAIPKPKIRKKIMVKRPQVTGKEFRPEPTLDVSIYNEILQVIYDVGKQFERLPSTYADKKEEDLRDHFLLYLEPRFEGSATGETFNKTGKTDILLRYEGSNVFIAECKFWRGKEKLLEAITQLLKYLTWRDSKAAVVVFVKNKEFTPILDKIEEVVLKHHNCLGFADKTDESWFNFKFHIEGDPNREVKLAVLLFHIPT